MRIGRDGDGTLKARGRVEPAFEVCVRPVAVVGTDASETMTRRAYKSVTFPGCVAETGSPLGMREAVTNECARPGATDSECTCTKHRMTAGVAESVGPTIAGSKMSTPDGRLGN